MLWSFVYLGLSRPWEFLPRLDVVTVGVSAFQRLVAAELACFTDAVVVYGIASSLSHDIDDFCAMAAEACSAQPSPRSRFRLQK